MTEIQNKSLKLKLKEKFRLIFEKIKILSSLSVNL